MKDLKPTCKIAVVQAAPIMFDKAACTEKIPFFSFPLAFPEGFVYVIEHKKTARDERGRSLRGNALVFAWRTGKAVSSVGA